MRSAARRPRSPAPTTPRPDCCPAGSAPTQAAASAARREPSLNANRRSRARKGKGHPSSHWNGLVLSVSRSVRAARAAASATTPTGGTGRRALAGAGAQARRGIRRLALPRGRDARERTVHLGRQALQAAQRIQDGLALRRTRELRRELVDGALAHLAIRTEEGAGGDGDGDRGPADLNVASPSATVRRTLPPARDMEMSEPRMPMVAVAARIATFCGWFLPMRP